MSTLVKTERIDRSILVLRGHKVMLGADLAQLYGVETKALNRAVKRNFDRFPADFMFQLTPDEAGGLRYYPGTSNLRCRSGTSSASRQRPRPSTETFRPSLTICRRSKVRPHAWTVSSRKF